MTLSHNVDLLNSLPPIPKIASEILSINLATDEGDERLLKLVAEDPAISARVIGLANSPLYFSARKILTVGDAVAVLGIKRIKMIALSFSMVSSLVRKPPGLLDVVKLWQHSMVIALAMDSLSKFMPSKIRPADDEIYLAGLLHDIGFLVLDHIEPELSNRFHARLVAENELASSQIESDMLEMSHGELGALLAEHWNLSATTVAVLRYHHASIVPKEQAGRVLIVMAKLAEKLLPTFCTEVSISLDINEKAWQILGIADDCVDEVEAKMRESVEEIASAFV